MSDNRDDLLKTLLAKKDKHDVLTRVAYDWNRVNPLGGNFDPFGLGPSTLTEEDMASSAAPTPAEITEYKRRIQEGPRKFNWKDPLNLGWFGQERARGVPDTGYIDDIPAPTPAEIAQRREELGLAPMLTGDAGLDPSISGGTPTSVRSRGLVLLGDDPTTGSWDVIDRLSRETPVIRYDASRKLHQSAPGEYAYYVKIDVPSTGQTGWVDNRGLEEGEAEFNPKGLITEGPGAMIPGAPTAPAGIPPLTRGRYPYPPRMTAERAEELFQRKTAEIK